MAAERPSSNRALVIASPLVVVALGVVAVVLWRNQQHDLAADRVIAIQAELRHRHETERQNREERERRMGLVPTPRIEVAPDQRVECERHTDCDFATFQDGDPCCKACPELSVFSRAFAQELSKHYQAHCAGIDCEREGGCPRTRMPSGVRCKEGRCETVWSGEAPHMPWEPTRRPRKPRKPKGPPPPCDCPENDPLCVCL